MTSTVHFDGIVSIKKTLLWASRRLVVHGDRIELSHIDRAITHKIVLLIENVTLAPIVRHHASFEFTVFASQGGYLQRYRIRMSNLAEMEKIYGIIETVKAVHVGHQRSLNAELKRSRSLKDPNVRPSIGEKPPLLSPRSHISLATSVLEVCLPENPHISVNVVVVILILFSAWIAPILNSWVTTMSIIVCLGIGIRTIMSCFDFEAPSVHLILAVSSRKSVRRKNSSASSVASDAIAFQRSRSYIEKTDFKVASIEEVEAKSSSGHSSIHELGYSTPVPGSPQSQRVGVLFSESSKFLSSFAADMDYRTCYAVMRSMSETIISLLQSQPAEIAPPSSISLVDALKEDAPSVSIVADDSDCTRSEWNVIRNKAGLKVLTSKLAHGMTRWPIISSSGQIRASLETVYRCVANPEIFRLVDEFGGEFKIVDYVELNSEFDEHQRRNSIDATNNCETGSEVVPSAVVLTPSTAPFLVKYQEMKSVWPVQPRDYLAGQSGFDLVVDGGTRRGKFLLSKSVDPNPKDPYPSGHDGFVRGTLTASAFLILENKGPETSCQVWTFLHCDMKGNLSGNGKIADFITQSQMPKFFAKLEAVCVEQQHQHQE